MSFTSQYSDRGGGPGRSRWPGRGRGAGRSRGPGRGRGLGRGRGRGYERGAMSMESLVLSTKMDQTSANQEERRQFLDDYEKGRQSNGDRENWRQDLELRQSNSDRENWRQDLESRQSYGDRENWRQDLELRQSNSDRENWRQALELRQSYGDRENWRHSEGRQSNGDRDKWRQNLDDRNEWGARTFGNRYGKGKTQGEAQDRWRNNSGNKRSERDESHFLKGKDKRRERYISNKELERLTTLQPDLVVYELLDEKSGFPLLIELGDFTPYKMDLTVKALAKATTTQSNREIMYELLNKTCTERFVAKLMDYTLTLKRDYPEKGSVFFAELHDILETFANAMITNAMCLMNLVDGCHSILVTLEASGHVEDYLVNKYKALLDFLTEASKRWDQERKSDTQARKKQREAEMDNMEPPDDFRELPVLPSQMDIMDTNRPFLRRNIVCGRYENGHHYLDVQFRLLREDFVRPLRVGIREFRSNTKSRIMDVRIYRNVTYIGSTVERRRIFHEVQLGSMKEMKLENSKRLMYGNLVCISNDDFSTFVIGSVADRNPEKLKEGIIGIEFDSDVSDIDTSRKFTMIESKAYFVAYKHVLQALKEMSEPIPMEMYVVHVEFLIDPPQYLDMEEVYDLNVMRSRTLMKKSEAFTRFFRHGHNKDITDEDEDDKFSVLGLKQLRRVNITRDLSEWPSEVELGLDSSQRRALRSALTRELAIIQGPPGTGKTFIGLKVVQTLLHNSQVWRTEENPTPILVVCFTNHALDQFLEGMTTFTNSIVRVGSRTQSEKISQFQINKLVQSVVSSRSLPKSIYNTKVDITCKLRQLEEKIHYCQEVRKECVAARGIFNLRVFSNIIPEHILQQLQQIPNEEKITHWLTHKFQAQSTPFTRQQASGSTAQGQPSQRQQQQKQPTPNNDIDSDEEVFQDTEDLIETEERDRKIDDDIEEPVNELVSKVKYEVTKEQLEEKKGMFQQSYETGDEDALLNIMIISGQLEAIMEGLSIPINSQDMEALESFPHLNIWLLEPRIRWQLYNHWVAKLHMSVKEAWNTVSENLQKKVKSYEGIRNAEYLYTMRKAAIVGMTTTGAAQYNSILRDLAPAIVIIEEAAEILESHVITSLTAGCQHLILIGDHQQLQPSATVYELATKYGLEISLFERMIKNGLAYETLEYQHRMRPEISRLLVPSIYPLLKDHPSVQDYPRVLGMVHNVFFLTHQMYEREEADDNKSHENQHEAELMIGLCRHFILQGYNPTEVTILTTYSGQFFLLRKLQRQNPECNGVRIAVVDNFQGEENKIILLSLVRSNPEGKVGFLRTENRVCVALSRAKHGLYITGNMDLLSKSSNLWKKINENLLQSESIGSAFTLSCENHPHQLTTVKTGRDFQAKSPEGGCLQVCAKPLPNCQHSCPRVCHLDDLEHKKYECRVPCPKTLCSLDHKCPKMCYEECGPCMVYLIKFLPCGHTHSIPCHVDPESYNCPTKVQKVIPACNHLVTMPCYHDPSTFSCPKDCDTRVDCGHKCRKKCHRTNDPDHEDYMCMEDCTEINIGCAEKHQCRRKCYQECGMCVEKVNKKLPCGHEEKNVECSQSVEEIQCKKPCKKTLPCDHKCKKLCYKECGDCKVAVKKVVPSCGHSIITACGEPPTTDQCDGPCPKKLQCGHPCRSRCKDDCNPECPELVVSANTCPKGHVIKVPCHLYNKVVGEAAWIYCTAPCNKKLDCEHACVGTCSRCLHGRLHVDCNKPCKKSLVCGHLCKFPCSTTCPPCQEKCQWKCSHSKCRQMCGRPCQLCKEKCTLNCKHKTCKKKCGEECEWRCKHDEDDKSCTKDCSKKPCEEPCRKELKCGHECVGLCGDPCPPLCRVCDHNELTEFVLLGNEDKPNARFVFLEDCGHCIEVKGLEEWLQHEDTEVGMKKCPKCNVTIYNNRRYQNIVLQAYKAVLHIKEKYYKSQNIKIKKKDIELIIQDQEILDCFKSECLQLLKKIGVETDRKKKPFEYFSVGEKIVCYFQAQVLKKATSILYQQKNTESKPIPSKEKTNILSKPILRGMVEAVVARVIEKTTTITPQMQREVSCEMQRLAVLPAYWTLREKSAADQNSNMVPIIAQVKVLMDPTVTFDEELDKKVQALLKESETYVGNLGISKGERIQIISAKGLHQGHWYKCHRGHIYCLTENEAIKKRNCPECSNCSIGKDHSDQTGH